MNGEIKFKNVSPENEQKFFDKYGEYNPTLVPEEPGKSQGTSQSQSNQQQTNTESNSEDGSSESQEIDPSNFEVKNAMWYEQIPGVGKNVVTNYIGDLERSWRGGAVQKRSLDPALNYYSKGKDMSEEELMELVKTGRDMEEYGRSDEMIAFDERYSIYPSFYDSVVG